MVKFLRILRGKAYLGLSKWALDPVTRILIRGRQQEERERHRDTETRCSHMLRIAFGSWERQGTGSPIGPLEGCSPINTLILDVGPPELGRE